VNEAIKKLWPEMDWIKDPELREKTAKTWEYAFTQSVLTPEDLYVVPFTLLTDKACSFVAHKRSVVHLCKRSAEIMLEFYGDALPINMDILMSGAILIDVGKLLEYTKKDGKLVVSDAGKLLRHPTSGVGLAARFDLPWEVLHIIASHSKEGDLGERSIEAIIVHHADFMSFEPFKTLKK
jgi:hypothetical protein